MTSYLGSDPATHILFRYNVLGLPIHLREFSKAVPRLNPSPPGLRNIDSRLSPRKEAARNSVRNTRGEASTTRRSRTEVTSRRTTEDTTPRADNRRATEDTTPATPTEESGETAVRWNQKPWIPKWWKLHLSLLQYHLFQ